MTHREVGWTRTMLLACFLMLGAVPGVGQSRIDVGASIGGGSFYSHHSASGLVLGATVGIRMGPSLTLAPHVSYWTDSDDSFLMAGPELRWTSAGSRRVALLAGAGIGAQSVDILSVGSCGCSGTEYLKSIVATLGAEYMLMQGSRVQPLLQGRMAMGLSSLEGAGFGSYDRPLHFTVGLGVRLGRR